MYEVLMNIDKKNNVTENCYFWSDAGGRDEM